MRCCLRQAGRFVGADINAYLLREAAAIAQHQELGDVIAFEVGSAEALPFPDGRFDAALACTVLDEVDANRGLAELSRVVRPGVGWRCWFVLSTYPRGTACRCGPSCGPNWQLVRVRASRPGLAQIAASIGASGPQGSPP